MIVKICGLTRIQDAIKAIEFGADELGWVIEPNSSRGQDLGELPTKLSSLYKELGFRPRCVAVMGQFRPEAMELPVDAIQCFPPKFPFSQDWIAAIRPQNKGEFTTCIKEASEAFRIVVDSFHPTVAGGTGGIADWELAKEIVEMSQAPVMLAGGLNTANVREAILTVRPIGVDVSSGVESLVGIKDWGKLRDFIIEAKSALV